MKKKILILDDNEKLLKRLKENISEFEVIDCQEIEDAAEKLMSEKVSFIAVDYDLGNDRTGDILYELLFQSGKSIPAMVFSGKELSEGTKKFLDSKGFSKILSKIDTQGTPSELIEKAANEILQDCQARIYQIRKKVGMIGNGELPLQYGQRVMTINEWIESIGNCEPSPDDEDELKRLIIENCLAIIKRQSDHDFDDI